MGRGGEGRGHGRSEGRGHERSERGAPETNAVPTRYGRELARLTSPFVANPPTLIPLSPLLCIPLCLDVLSSLPFSLILLCYEEEKPAVSLLN